MIPRPTALMRQVLKALAAAAFVIAFIESARSGALLWREGPAAMGWLDWLWIGLAPVLLWIWLRRYSVFAPDKGRCLLPPDERR